MGAKFRRVAVGLGGGASKTSFAQCLVLSSPEDTRARGPCSVTVI